MVQPQRRSNQPKMLDQQIEDCFKYKSAVSSFAVLKNEAKWALLIFSTAFQKVDIKHSIFGTSQQFS